MSKFTRSQAGFSILEGLLIVAVVALVGFLGWMFYQNMVDQNTNEQTSSETATNDAPEVNDTSDLEDAENYLNDTDINKELDTSDIDSALSE